jgi:hypothetical protein
VVPGDSVSAPTALSVEGVAHVETDGRSSIYEGESGEATRRAEVSAVTARRTRAPPPAGRPTLPTRTSVDARPHPPLTRRRRSFHDAPRLCRGAFWGVGFFARTPVCCLKRAYFAKPERQTAWKRARLVPFRLPTSGRCPARAGPGRYALIEHGAATTVYVRARPPHDGSMARAASYRK